MVKLSSVKFPSVISNDSVSASWGVRASSIDYRENILTAIDNQIKFGTQAACSFIDVDNIVLYTALRSAIDAKEILYGKFKFKIACQTLKGVLNSKNHRTKC